ncbi:MAG: NAD-dependent epimerase/dehydratase family protein [Fibromonadaceae bacterium]|jgi:UDP-glucuronate 4-epimerase|nr:NAD-dependent epimerase/dehydratase family protein [Fibromonadaceae bacterium]
MNILVTGVAGFIGNAVSIALLQRGDKVVGLDNMNNYYSVELKEARLKRLDSEIYRIDICDKQKLMEVFRDNKIDAVVHLAAQAGVRYSLENPQAYIDSNITGTLNIFECCKDFGVKNIVFASSSSVYGDNAKIPFSTEDRTDNPVSLYAATKKSCELMAHTYSHLFGLNITGLRYFTVYGPWGRPDMAPMLFAKNILEGKPIKVFNNGNMKRDFTYIEDIVNGTISCLNHDTQDLRINRIFNIGRGEPVDLMRFIEILENGLGKKAIKEFLPMQAGDVPVTWADTSALEKATGYRPKISLETGIKHFAEWYLEFSHN